MATAASTRRHVRYSSLDEIIADAERAVRDKATTTGNWSLGQILEHLAIAQESMIDGFGFTTPWPVRTVGRVFFKNRLLTKGMTPGFKLPAKGARLIPDETDAGDAFEHLRRSAERLKAEQKRSAHPFLGPLTVDEATQLCLRHAELHMSFVTA